MWRKLWNGGRRSDTASAFCGRSKFSRWTWLWLCWKTGGTDGNLPNSRQTRRSSWCLAEHKVFSKFQHLATKFESAGYQEINKLYHMHKIICEVSESENSYESSHWWETLFLPSVYKVVFPLISFALTLTVHTGDTIFACTVCKRIFGNSEQLKRHSRVHTGEKPYSCPQCTTSFSQSSHLLRHSRVHTGEKPFVCSLCTKTFGDSQNLQRHLKFHTCEKPHTCPHCKKTFPDNLICFHI